MTPIRKQKLQRRAETREGFRVTSVAFEDDTLRRLAYAAADLGVTKSIVLRMALDEWLDRYEKEKRGK